MRMVAFVFAGLLMGSAYAVPVASNLVADGLSGGIPGQSFTVVSTGPVDHIVINFFSDLLLSVPSAIGNGYLFSAPYLGDSATIASATLNLLGSTAASGNHWSFDPALVLQPNTQYFFYSDSFQPLAGTNNPYTGGDFYYVGIPPGTGPYTLDSNADTSFLVDGSLVATGAPELNACSGLLPLASVFCMIALALSSTSAMSPKRP